VSLRRATLVAAAIALAPSSGAIATAASGSSHASSAWVGEPPGPAARERLDAARLGRSTVAFPKAPTERWRLELGASLEHPPLVDEHGHAFLVLTTGEFVSVSKAGAVAWRRRAPCTLSKAPPARVATGAIAVLCGDGVVLFLDREGAVVAKIVAGGAARLTDVAPLATDDGGLFVALDEELVRFTGDGTASARARVKPAERIADALLPHDGGVLFLGVRGTVFGWRPPHGIRELGSLGGTTLRGGVRLGPRAIAAVVDGQRLVAFDPVSHESRTLATTEVGASFEGMPAATGSGELVITTNVGQLLRLSPTGELLDLVEVGPLHKAMASPVAAARAGRELRWSPPPIVDPSGVIAYVRHQGPAGLLEPGSTAPRAFAPVPCSLPTAIVPAGSGVLLVACSNGSLSTWSDP
jgi:hypothetical protein